MAKKKTTDLSEIAELMKDKDLSQAPVEEVKVKEVKAESEAKAVVTEKKAKVAKEEKAEKVEKSKKKKGKEIKSKRGSNYQAAYKKLDKSKNYDVLDAVKALNSARFAKFTESYELHITLGIDPKNTDQRVRFSTSLPHGTGKIAKILVISDDNSGVKDNVTYRNATVIEDILKGTLSAGKDFGIVITTPTHMKDLGKAAKILGPKGLMPNPKNGTVTNEIDKTISDLSKGQIEIKNQNGHGVIHLVIGNSTFKEEQIAENANFILTELNKNIPAKLKKKFLQKAFLTTTMSPSLRIAL